MYYKAKQKNALNKIQQGVVLFMCNSCFDGNNCWCIILLIFLFLIICGGCGNNNDCGCGGCNNNCGCGC